MLLKMKSKALKIVITSFGINISSDPILYIEKQISVQKFSKQLENTNEEITLNGIVYSKIKIKKEISVAYTSSENILFVTINDNQINIIDTENIHSETYFNNSITGYGGNSVSLKASEYDSSNGTLNDITSDVVKNQNEKISARKEINDRKSEIRDQLTSVLFPIGFIIISVCIAILLGKLVDKFVKTLKNKF